jgi:hypothetical protein
MLVSRVWVPVFRRYSWFDTRHLYQPSWWSFFFSVCQYEQWESDLIGLDLLRSAHDLWPYSCLIEHYWTRTKQEWRLRWCSNDCPLMLKRKYDNDVTVIECWSRWLCRLRPSSAAARLVELRFRIPLRVWMFVSCDYSVFCRYWQSDRSFRGVILAVYAYCVWSINLKKRLYNKK